MGFGSASLLAKINFILVIVAFVIQLLAFAIPYWYAKDYGNSIKAYGGLWKRCVETSIVTTCSTSNKGLADWIKATQAMETIGFLLLLVAVVVIIVYVFVMTDTKLLNIVFVVLCFCAFGFIILGVIIYGAEASGVAAEYSGSFALAIIAAIVALACGIIGVLDILGLMGK